MMNGRKIDRNGTGLAFKPLALVMLSVLVFGFQPRAVPATEITAESVATALKRAVTLADLPPGYRQDGEIVSKYYQIQGLADARVGFLPPGAVRSTISVTLKLFKNQADAEADFRWASEYRTRISENVIARDAGVGSRSFHVGFRKYLDSAHSRYEMVSQTIEAMQGNWVVLIILSNYKGQNYCDFSDAEAGNFLRKLAATALGRLGGSEPDSEAPDCGKAGALTRYLQALRAHQERVAGIDRRLSAMLAEREPDPRQVVAIGREALEAGGAYLGTLRDFQRGETRRGLMEELDLLVDTTDLLNKVVIKYQALARVPLAPVNPETRKRSRDEVLSTLLALAREQCTARLDSEGLRDILNSASWGEALDRTVFHVQRKVNELLDRETEKIFGIGFHDAQSARRALQLQMRREVRRHVAKLLVKITSNEIVIEILAAPIIRWIERDLLPRLQEALREKGHLPERVTRSVRSLENAREALNRLTCDARIQDVRQVLAAATGTLNATCYLQKDLKAAQDFDKITTLGNAIGRLKQTMHLTWSRFLLSPNDYEDDLPIVVDMVGQLLENLRSSIPALPDEGQRYRITTPDPPVNLDLAADFMRGLTGDGTTGPTSIRATEAVVKFFESDLNMGPRSLKRYGQKFKAASTRALYWELNLAYPAPGRRIDFRLDATWYREDGSVLVRQTLDTYVEAAWVHSQHLLGWGWEEPGNWAPGTYRLELSVKGNKVAEGFVKIK